jgi:YVTN family beta-propeller protein
MDADASVEFHLLGPFEVLKNGIALHLGGSKQRALLAVLVARTNVVVSTDRLIDELWGERPPASAAHSLEVYVSHLRKVLETDGAPRILLKRPRGYLLQVEFEQVDARQFERLCEQGRRALAVGDTIGAAELLREALSSWRGEPLAELRFEGGMAVEIERIQELRLAALEDVIEAELALGRHASLVGEVEALVEQHPLRERLRAELMLALYRSGRQAEALEVYREARDLLVEQLGIEPGEELKRLQRAILRHDPAVEAPSPPFPEMRELVRRPLVIGAVVLVLAAAVAVAAVVLLRRPGHHSGHVDPSAVGAIDQRTGSILGQIHAETAPTDAAAGAGSLWVTSIDGGTLLRIDPKALQLRDTIEVGNGPTGVAFANGMVWVANSLDGTVSRIDPSVDRIVQTIPVGSGPTGIAAGYGFVWATNTADETLSRIDPASGRVTATIPTTVPSRNVAVGAGAVWVTDDTGKDALRIDPQTNRITAAVGVGNGPDGLAFADGSLWVANGLDGTVSRVDPEAAKVTATIATGASPGGLAGGGKGIWVSDESSRTISHIDSRANRVMQRINTGSRPRGIVLAAGRVWVAAEAGGAVHRGGMLTVLSYATPFDTSDPALAYVPTSWSLLSMTNDGLTGFARFGGSDGARIVPDLAVSLPTPTAGGTIYTFRVRPGIRYSTGGRVRPEDFRRALERSLALGSPGSGYYRNIVGAYRCLRKNETCDLSLGVIADDRANSVTYRLLRPDPEFLYKLALPFAYAVPARTPVRHAERPLPATGPYVIARYDAKRGLKLVRNPYFREWSRAAQPDGYPDEIVWHPNADPETAVTAVERRKADVLLQAPPADRLSELRTRFARQLHISPGAGTLYLFLNTRVAPFDDVRVRRALNYAVDRNRVATLAGGRSYVRPTCQVLPAAFPGYRAYCPYTLAPSRSGAWHAPDLVKAKRLVALSGTRGERVRLWATPTASLRVNRLVLLLLKRLGYRSSLKIVRGSEFYAAVRNSATRAQIGLDGWTFDYPTASNFIVPTLSCTAFRRESPSNTNDAEFCDPPIDAKMQKALAVEEAHPDAANRLWAQIDRDLVDQAPWVPLVNFVWADFVSKRVGDYQYNPQWHALVDQLWVR